MVHVIEDVFLPDISVQRVNSACIIPKIIIVNVNRVTCFFLVEWHYAWLIHQIWPVYRRIYPMHYITMLNFINELICEPQLAFRKSGQHDLQRVDRLKRGPKGLLTRSIGWRRYGIKNLGNSPLAPPAYVVGIATHWPSSIHHVFQKIRS